MVRKLFKHEAAAYLHTLLPMNLILIGIALLTRIVWIFESKTVAFNIIGTSSIVALVIAMLVCIVMSAAFAVIRFYKNLFTCEGYLTMTLPVTTGQHITVKLLSAVLFNLMTVVAVVLAACISMAGDMIVEVFKAGGYLLKRYFQEFGAEGAGYIAELVILILVVVATQFLLFYACISVGQLARKNRVLAALGVYFGYYLFCQIMGTVFMVIVMLCADTELFRMIGQFIDDNPRLTVHIALIASTVFSAALGAVYYAVTHTMIKKHLNLE